jgi:putative acetyltransferase
MDIMKIRLETPADHAAIRNILLAAFANHPYSRQTEHLIVEALRAANAMSVGLVAVDENPAEQPSPPTPLPKGEGTRDAPSPPTPLPKGEGTRDAPSPPAPLPKDEGTRDAPSPPAALPKGEGRVVGQIAFSAAKIDGRECGWFMLGPVAVEPSRQRQGIGQALVRQGLQELRRLGAQGCVLVGDPAFYRHFGFQCHSSLKMEGVPPEVILCLPLTDRVPQGEVTHHPAFFAGQ